MKILFITLGTLSLSLGVIGVVVPGLPTTPFLLLSAGLYFKSSQRLYNWLLGTKYLGSYIRNYRENNGVSKKTKYSAIAIMWTMILSSAFIFITLVYLKVILIIVGIIGTLVMLKYIPIKK